MHPRLSPFALTIVVAMALLAGCKDKQDATRQAWLDGVGACPAPAKCTGKARAAARDVATCEPTIDTKTLAAGDVVVVKEKIGFDTVGKIKTVKPSGGFDVEFPDGFVLDRPAESVVGRLCK